MNRRGSRAEGRGEPDQERSTEHEAPQKRGDRGGCIGTR
jgi:hypothetical protein